MTDTATHLLGHGSCPACQDDGRRLIKELCHLRAINAKLLEALEGIRHQVDNTAPYSDELKDSIVAIGAIARAAIEEARK